MQTRIYSSLQLAATVEVPSTDFVCLQSGRHHASKGDTMVHKNVSVPLLVELWSRCCAPRNMSSQIYDQSSCVSDISSLCTAGSVYFTVTHPETAPDASQLLIAGSPVWIGHFAHQSHLCCNVAHYSVIISWRGFISMMLPKYIYVITKIFHFILKLSRVSGQP